MAPRDVPAQDGSAYGHPAQWRSGLRTSIPHGTGSAQAGRASGNHESATEAEWPNAPSVLIRRGLLVDLRLGCHGTAGFGWPRAMAKQSKAERAGGLQWRLSKASLRPLMCSTAMPIHVM